MPMFKTRPAARLGLIALVAAALAFAAGPSRADPEDRPFDFTDAFYKQNGVDPAKIQGRKTGADGRSVIDRPLFPARQRNVRLVRINPAYSDSGDLNYWTVAGDLFADGFTDDAAGRKAKGIADTYVLYVFPRRDQADPVTLGANRQADIVDLRNGYFSKNPLGLWLHTWVSYTDAAFATAGGKKALADLAGKNGLALDGTPIIRTTSELEDLVKNGYAAKRLRKADGSEGTMYGICPVIKDPTDGGITKDAVLSYVKNADGTPLEPAFVDNFLSLQKTGRWAD